ncbi:MAG TPA: PAS domain S-box protein [Bacteroidota bacterium]|nr:PAS domain S-box protein [Bacteroidota bacterium]
MRHESGEVMLLRVLCLGNVPLAPEPLRALLTKAGYSVDVHQANPTADLATFLRGRPCDVILCGLPTSGPSIVDALKISLNTCPNIPFICLSPPLATDAAADLRRQGATDFVAIDALDRLPSVIRRALEKNEKETSRHSEERYRALFEYSPDALYVHVNGTTVLANPACCQLLGATDPSQLIGRSVFEIAHPDSHEAIRQRWKLLEQNTAAPPLEEKFVRLDGTVIDVEVRAVPIDWMGEKGVQVIARDITERKRDKEALEKSEELYRAVFETTGTATVLLEENTVISLANSEFERLSQYSKQELEGKKSWTEFVVKDDLERMRAQHDLRRRDRGAALKEYEFRFVRRDRGVRDILLTIDIIPGTTRSVASLLDITARKQAEEEIRESEERFRMFFQHVFDGVCIYTEDPDPARRTLIDCNERYAEMAGRSRAELLEMGRTHTIQKTLDPAANIHRLESVAAKKAYRGSFSWIRPDGKDNVIEYVGTPITWKGKPYSIGIDRDITEWEKAQKRLESLAHERGMLLKEIYHRVNNNLQVISSLLNLQARQVNDKKFSELLSESQLRVRAMALVHERLYRSQDLSSIDFADYLRGVTSQLAQAFERPNVTLALEVESIRLRIDLAIPAGLIVNELVTNAFKHAFPGNHRGRITISLHRCDERATQLGVADNGVGLPKGLDFASVSSMGFSLVKDLTSQINGTISLPEGEGTTFWITIPA